jgi:hypothetical protein
MLIICVKVAFAVAWLTGLLLQIQNHRTMWETRTHKGFDQKKTPHKGDDTEFHFTLNKTYVDIFH